SRSSTEASRSWRPRSVSCHEASGPLQCGYDPYTPPQSHENARSSEETFAASRTRTTRQPHIWLWPSQPPQQRPVSTGPRCPLVIRDFGRIVGILNLPGGPRLIIDVAPFPPSLGLCLAALEIFPQG